MFHTIKYQSALEQKGNKFMLQKSKRKSIERLKLEIEEINSSIQVAETNGRSAFARRLKLILKKKKNILNGWISNS